MGIESLEIEFDNPFTLYYAGQSVTGRIITGIEDIEKVRGIQICFLGKAFVVKGSGFGNRILQRHNRIGSMDLFSDVSMLGTEQIYVDSRSYVFGTGEETDLSAGKHVHYFSHTLPLNLPSSYQGEYGYVSYEVNAFVDRVYGGVYSVTSPIIVHTLVDLNSDPCAQSPLSAQGSWSCCSCFSHPLLLEVKLPSTGFLAGDVIPLTVLVANGTMIDVSMVQVELKQKNIYRSSGELRVENNLLLQIPLGSVPSHDRSLWVNEPLILPTFLLPTNNNLNHLISHRYSLMVTAQPSILGFNLKALVISIPIIIGNLLDANFDNISEPEVLALPNTMHAVQEDLIPSAPPITPVPDMDSPTTQQEISQEKPELYSQGEAVSDTAVQDKYIFLHPNSPMPQSVTDF